MALKQATVEQNNSKNEWKRSVRNERLKETLLISLIRSNDHNLHNNHTSFPFCLYIQYIPFHWNVFSLVCQHPAECVHFSFIQFGIMENVMFCYHIFERFLFSFCDAIQLPKQKTPRSAFTCIDCVSSFHFRILHMHRCVFVAKNRNAISTV